MRSEGTRPMGAQEEERTLGELEGMALLPLKNAAAGDTRISRAARRELAWRDWFSVSGAAGSTALEERLLREAFLAGWDASRMPFNELAEARHRGLSPHFHASTGVEDTPCYCSTPGTYAPGVDSQGPGTEPE